jgi:hypothetical protein
MGAISTYKLYQIFRWGKSPWEGETVMKKKISWWAAIAVFLFPTIPTTAFAAPEDAINPKGVIQNVLNGIIGVGVGVATVYCIANALFLLISYMSKQEGHDRAELKGKLQYLVILEVLALSIGGIIWWINGMV